ncbi:MAG: hypothetical protein ACREEM_35555 [Blastocatellia bacterium]
MFADKSQFGLILNPRPQLLLRTIGFCIAGLIAGYLLKFTSAETLLALVTAMLALISGVSSLWSP